MKRFIAAMLLGLIATPAPALTLDDLSFDDCIVSVVIADTRPKMQARFARMCPSGQWVLAADGGEIVCDYEDANGDGVTSVLALHDQACLLP
jgi:hypothetical protein